MAEITISGKKILRTINREFQERFPYLGLRFFTPEEWEKAREEQAEIIPLEDNLKLAAVRKTVPGKDEKEISIHGRLLVKNLEDNFLKTYGLYCQVIYGKDDKKYYTTSEHDGMSLNQLNLKLEEAGYSKNP